MDYIFLQNYWWFLVSLLGALLVFLLFVQGGNSLLFTLGRNDEERALLVNSTGRKWEFTFTTLVTFGGAFFASFPLFYSTSFGGAYWSSMIIAGFCVLWENKKSWFRLEIRILLSFAFLQSGATRNRIILFKVLICSTLISLEKSPNHWISHMPNSLIFDRFLLIIFWLYKGKCSVLFLQMFI